MLAKVRTIAVTGLSAYEVEVEVDVLRSMPCFAIVGLADTAVQEAKERIRSSIRNSGFAFPNQRIILNLAPAHIRKQSPAFDVPMAIGILAASGQVKQTTFDSTVIVGELALNGEIRPIRGALSIVLCAKKMGLKTVILPFANLEEVAVVKGITVYGAKKMSDIVSYLQGNTQALYTEEHISMPDVSYNVEAFDQVKGQTTAKRVLEIAAAGGHNLIFCGPPGAGKSMLAKAFACILPPLTQEESIQVTQIYSNAGLLPEGTSLVSRRPFRTVHHTASSVSIVGGGSQVRPGEVSLAHNGVLFLDELPEFPQEVLEVLRQPLEDREISVSRASGTVVYPASFSLIAAMNPCPCGYFSDGEKECTCSRAHVLRYASKVSGPLLDRIDLFLSIARPSISALKEKNEDEKSGTLVRENVLAARKIQQERFEKYARIHTNAEMNNKLVKDNCVCTREAESVIQTATERYKLSARSYFRLLKISRTIADLGGSEVIEEVHVREALLYRKR